MTDDLITKVHNDVTHEQKNSDGIIQIANGLFLIVFALCRLSVYAGAAWIFFIPIPILVKHLRKRYTYPRIGYAKLKLNDRFGITWSQFIYSVLAFGIFAYFMLTNTEDFPNISNKLFFPTMLVFYIAVIIYAIIYYQRKRKPNLVWLLTSIIWGAAWLLWIAPDSLHFKINDVKYASIILFAGLLNLVYGIKVLRAFIIKYPVLNDDE
jgi:hypothetical protein